MDKLPKKDQVVMYKKRTYKATGLYTDDGYGKKVELRVLGLPDTTWATLEYVNEVKGVR